jgi:PAT family beta-lactamase induction signal transducer AmpG
VYFPWPVVYAVLAVIQGIGMLAVWKAPRDDEDDGTSLPSPALSGWFHTGVIAPLKPLLTLPNLAGLLALLLLYKLADGYLGSMTYKFLRETGFEKPDIVTTQQIVGLLATMAGGAFGGWIATKMPLARFLLLGGVLQMASNMVYYWLARQGAPDLSHLRIAVLVEETAGGIGTAAFMAFVAHLCHRSFAVTHYAFFTSLMALGRIVVSSSSGYAAVHLGWPLFFIASTFMAVPGLLLVVWMQPLLNRLARGAGRPPVLPAS